MQIRVAGNGLSAIADTPTPAYGQNFLHIFVFSSCFY